MATRYHTQSGPFGFRIPTREGSEADKELTDIASRDRIGDFVRGAFERGSDYAGVDPRGRMSSAAADAGRFAGAGERDYASAMAGMGNTASMLRDRAMGGNSLAAEQIRQGLQQQQSQMVSMAQGGDRRNAAMRMRQALQAAGRAGTAAIGQGAMAGIAERNAAVGQLAGLQQSMGQLGANVATTSRGNELNAYGNIEGNRTQRYQADMGVPSTGERLIGAASAGAKLAALSDVRAKTDIRSGDRSAEAMMDRMRSAYIQGQRDGLVAKRKQVNMEQDRDRLMANRKQVGNVRANTVGTIQGLDALRKLTGTSTPAVHPDDAQRMMDSLKSYKYKHKDPARHGGGERLGVMAQDLEKTPAGSRMVFTSGDGTKGVQIDSSSLLAGLANLHDRVKKVEKGKK